MVVFIKCGWFQHLVYDIWDGLNPANTIAPVEGFYNNMQDNYEDHLEFNRTRWGYPESDELCNASRAAAEDSQHASAEYLKTWIYTRWSAVNTIISAWEH